MIEAICENDSNRPKEIPLDKWIVKGKTYHITYTVWSITSKKLGVHLDEIFLDESCSPYGYFAASRFSFTHENLLLLMQLIQDCDDTAFSMEELLEQTILEPNK